MFKALSFNAEYFFLFFFFFKNVLPNGKLNVSQENPKISSQIWEVNMTYFSAVVEDLKLSVDLEIKIAV